MSREGALVSPRQRGSEGKGTARARADARHGMRAQDGAKAARSGRREGSALRTALRQRALGECAQDGALGTARYQPELAFHTQ